MAMEHIFLRKGLRMMLYNSGSGAATQEGDLVSIKYDIFHADGSPKLRDQTLSFIVGYDLAITAIDQSVLRMNVGALAKITTVPEYAYGKLGLKPFFGPDDHITFILTLEENHGPFDPKCKMPFADRHHLAESMRERGNFLYERNYNQRAIAAYMMALECMFGQKYKLNEEEEELMDDLTLKCYNNLAATHLRIEQYEEAQKYANCALKLDITEPKALYRKGMALKGLGHYELASKCFQASLDFAPDHKIVTEQLIEVINLMNGIPTEDAHVEVEDEPGDDEKNGFHATEESTKKAPFQKLPGWVKWAAGAAALAGAGLLAYNWFK